MMLRQEERRTAESELGELMGAAQDGDKAAYLTLLRAVAPIVRRIVGRRLGDMPGAEVEDLVQDILLSLHIARHTYNPKQAFMPWLMALCRHRLADGWRRGMKVANHETYYASMEETFSGAAANTSSELEIDRQSLHAAIARLPKAQQEAVKLVRLKEMSFKEAAQRTGLSVNALKVAVHRGIKSLRASLGRNDQDED